MPIHVTVRPWLSPWHVDPFILENDDQNFELMSGTSSDRTAIGYIFLERGRPYLQAISHEHDIFVDECSTRLPVLQGGLLLTDGLHLRVKPHDLPLPDKHLLIQVEYASSDTASASLSETSTTRHAFLPTPSSSSLLREPSSGSRPTTARPASSLAEEATSIPVRTPYGEIISNLRSRTAAAAFNDPLEGDASRVPLPSHPPEADAVVDTCPSFVTALTSASGCPLHTIVSTTSPTSVPTSVLGSSPAPSFHIRLSSSSRFTVPSYTHQERNSTTAEVAVKRMRAAWLEAATLVRSVMTTIDSVEIALQRVRAELLRARTVIHAPPSTTVFLVIIRSGISSDSHPLPSASRTNHEQQCVSDKRWSPLSLAAHCSRSCLSKRAANDHATPLRRRTRNLGSDFGTVC
ncbi:unnamed protein product [Tilletia laevis]|uniref:Uncharacterized protein n=2 Tax=Tilletia TaxID=13289 RepID=A0A177T2H9_9BASI|nr:hypothetical protein CF335_g9019 [Tilletia laevis]KAE8245908.1 hypothetical protein A4X03_0g7384 [Tilletia caries]KAE8184035.1 hypothetical protein CF336_g7950 [Tilletia laevis]CAD6889414.1 unnamed protein product [Tilletia caries]CAD6939734.1 unnamed protein product [Tilletia caries]